MVSIIVTVYNTPIHDLKRCIQSIKDQNYSDYEVVIVNDGSQTSVAEVLDVASQEDGRFHVYHIKNGGVSHARNVGIKHARGEYIAFCDSDDEILPDFLKSGLSHMNQHSLDIIVGGVIEKSHSTSIVKKCDLHGAKIKIYANTDIEKLLDYAITSYCQEDNKELGNILLARVYPKIYRSELVKETLFREDIKMSEDNIFTFEIFGKCHRIGISEECWYRYYQNEYSLTHHNDGIAVHRIKEQYDFAKAVLELRNSSVKSFSNAYNIRLLHIFVNYFGALADSIFWLSELKRTCRLPFFQDALKADLSDYVDVSDSDYLFLRMMASPCKLYAYFVWRCIRRKLGVIKRYMH